MRSKKTSIFLCVVMVATVFAVAVPVNVSAEEPYEPWNEEENGWSIDANGTYFEITNSSYLNVTLTSSENVHVHLESVPKIVSFHIEADCSATSTIITLSGFEVGRVYYRYQDGHWKKEFTADETGSYSFTQDIASAHHVYIQETTSTIYISSDYTFTNDINDQIVVTADDIVIDGNGYTLQGLGWDYGIYMSGRSGVTIKNININGFTYGIHLYHSNSNTIIDNIFSNNWHGIYLWKSSGNTISGNTVSDNFRGIYLHYYSRSNIITGNTISGNSGGIVLIDQSDSNTISQNTASSNRNGIALSSSSNIIVNGNTVLNGLWGIYLAYSSSNTITSNTISNNRYGFYSYNSNSNTINGNMISGNNLFSFYLRYSNANIFYHNNIINNRNQLNIYSSSNGWDNGVGEGNYWSDYTGSDINNDGIGDTNVPHQGVDWYPFMEPWGSPEAEVGGPYEANEGSEILFDASISIDPNDDELKYRWDFDNDGEWDTSYSSDPIATYIWYDDYTSNIVVEVFDGEFTDTDTATVTVNNVAPTASIDNVIQPFPDFILPADVLEFYGSFSDPGWLDIHTIEWDLGDGNTTTGTLTPTHAYAQPGIYTVTLTVIDDDGGVGTTSTEIIVETPAEATQEVFEDIQEMELQNGMNESLSSKLENAIDSMDNDQDTAAVNQLNAFINQVEAQRGKKLTDEEADALIAAAQWIIGNISGE